MRFYGIAIPEHSAMDHYDFMQNEEIRSNRAADARLEQQIRDQQRQIDRLKHVCRALCEVLESHSGIGAELIQEKIKELDVRETLRQTCEKCGRTLQSNPAKCTYCGHSQSPRTDLDSLF